MVDNSCYGIDHLEQPKVNNTRWASEEGDATHLDQTICRITIPNVGNGERFTRGYSLRDLGGADLDGEEGNGMLLLAIWVEVVCVLVVLGVVDFGEAHFGG